MPRKNASRQGSLRSCLARPSDQHLSHRRLPLVVLAAILVFGWVLTPLVLERRDAQREVARQREQLRELRERTATLREELLRSDRPPRIEVIPGESFGSGWPWESVILVVETSKTP